MPKAKEEVKKEEVVEEVENETLFTDGPTDEEIEDLKLKTGGELFATRILDQVFLWRPLKRKEYKDIVNIPGADSYFREEKIAEKCVLWPANKNELIRNGNAGLASMLSDVISEESGFTRDVQTVKL